MGRLHVETIQIDSALLRRTADGAVLTPEGEQILAAYQRFSADINAYSQARFQETFQDWI